MPVFLEDVREKINEPLNIFEDFADRPAICELSFEEIFKTCVEEVYCVKYSESKILNLQIVKRIQDYELTPRDLTVALKLMEGVYENGSREELIENYVEIWNKSEIFRSSSEGILKALENHSLKVGDLKIFNTYENNIKVTNLRRYYQFMLNETFKPIRNYLLFLVSNIYKDRIYKVKDNPLRYKLIDFEKASKFLSEGEVSVIGNNKVYKLLILDKRSEAVHA